MDADLNKNFEKVFQISKNLWEYTPDSHLMVIATFVLDDAGIPTVEEMCVMLTSPEWLPVDNKLEQQLIAELVKQKRSFQKQLRYNLPPDKPIATAVLTDCYNAPLAMYIDVDDLVGRWASTVAINEVVKSNSIQTWMWVPRDGLSPDLPAKMGMEPKPIPQVDEPLPMAEEEAAATPSSGSAVISEPADVEAAPLGDIADELSSWGEPAIPSVFQPKTATNVTVMTPRTPALAEVTPISQPKVDLTGFPFMPGYGPKGPIAPVESAEPNQ
jgi:hypothetical protein